MTPQGQPLRQRISGELTRILRGHVLLLTALLSMSLLLLGYYFKLSQLAHQQDLVRIRLGTELRNFARELHSLSHAPWLATLLLDSGERADHLGTLRSHFMTDGLHGLMVLDHRGRMIHALAPPPALALGDAPAVHQAMAHGAPAHGLSQVEGGGLLLALVYPVFLSELDAPVGFIVGTLDLQALLVTLPLGRAQPSVAVGDSPWWPPLPVGLVLRHRSEDSLVTDGSELRLRLTLTEPLLPWLAMVGLVAAVLFLLGQWTLGRVAAWARGFAATTTDRLEHLVTSSRQVLAGQPPPALPTGPQDEISQAVDALSAMLRQQKEVTDALRTTSLVFATAAEGIVVTDAQATVTRVNPALLRMTGWQADELIGQPVSSLYRLADGQLHIGRALGQLGRWSGDCSLLDRQGRALDMAASVSRIEGEDGACLGQVWIFTDVGRLKRAEKQLREMAYRDGLTRLPNLRMMGELMRQRLDASPAPFALLFLDLDRLKQVNDSQGHEAGDWLIRGMAEHLRRQLPPGHLLCRRSGDEFIALVDRDPQADALGWQTLLAQLSRARILLPAGPIDVSATIGVARYPRDASLWPELQVCADAALRCAKQARRGSVLWYEPHMGRDLRRKGLLHQRLVQAVEQQQIGLHYQPVVDLATGRLLGAEALARWTDPVLGAVSPGEFFAAAEQAQVADALSLQLLHTLLRDMPRIQQRWPGLALAFNVTPQALRDPRLYEALAQAAVQHPGWPALLALELTESALAGSDDALLLPLHKLGGLGIGLVIDDFGTGHSSLSRLAQFSLSGLKIDASFVASLDQGRHQRIVDLVLNLAQVLQLQVTAEGVETQAQRLQLLELGCVRGQGWLYGPALDLEQLLSLPAHLPTVQAADRMPA